MLGTKKMFIDGFDAAFEKSNTIVKALKILIFLWQLCFFVSGSFMFLYNDVRDKIDVHGRF